MQLDFIADLFSDLPADEPAPTRAPVVADPLHAHFTITATARGVCIVAPEQRVADRPFQPVAERPLLPAVRHVFTWAGIRGLFRRWAACEPLGLHPLAPWVERIIAAVAPLEGLTLDVAPWCVSWTRLTCRSTWTGLERDDVLRHAESTGCDTHQQALARADAVSTRLRAAGRVVEIRDLVPADAPPPPPRYVGPTKEVRLGCLVITLPVETRV